nr:unnamed protein product [Spirometra erinaceieuropaei]
MYIPASATIAKRSRRPVMATNAAGQLQPSCLSHTNDKSSVFRFLVDTGAKIGVLPPHRRHRLKPSQLSLQPANSTSINTYGQRLLTLGIGLQRRLQWTVLQSELQPSIIGMISCHILASQST